MSRIHEHDQEPVAGLPGVLPNGETMIWQGGPGLRRLLLSGLRLRALAVYFTAVVGLHAFLRLGDGVGQGDIAAVAGGAALAAAALGIVALYGWLAARATRYTITSRRIVIRCGVALPVSVNLPLALIDSADLREFSDGTGDIFLTTGRGGRASYVLLWPNVRFRRLIRVQPALRALDDAPEVARLLGEGLARQAAESVRPDRAGPAPSAAPVAAAERSDWRDWLRYPTAPLTAAAGLVILALVSVSLLRFTGGSPQPGPTVEPLATLDLHFEDQPGGAVAVIAATDGRLITEIQPGADGFVRATMRTLAAARGKVDHTDEVPFRLVHARDGRLLLVDPVTRREIDLWAFGATNAGAFARYLELARRMDPPATIELTRTARSLDETALASTHQENRP